MKLKMPGESFFGLYTIMEMPRDMKGFENSITRSRSELIVNGAIAMSASCEIKQSQDHGKFTSTQSCTPASIQLFVIQNYHL